MFLLIGSIPRSLACPIILWNIQGNVSSCCHSNYYNIPHGSWLSSFWKCFSFFSPSSQLSSSHVRPVDLSRASVPSPEETQHGEEGTCAQRGRDGAGASWKDPPRICWIKTLHLDVIVPPLCWDSLSPWGDQISGWKIVTCQDTRPHLESYFTKTERFLLTAG